jgi:hypothetical protein
MKSRDTSKFRDPLINLEDRKYAEKHGKLRCKACLDWIKGWQWDSHCVDHEASDFRRKFPERLHTELRVCLSCIFVTDSDSEMTAHLHDDHHQTSPTPSEIRGEQLNRVKPYLDFDTGPAIRLHRDAASDLMRENVPQRSPTLDATRDYAHPARERGHYGSHSSHDDFSDESGPDNE